MDLVNSIARFSVILAGVWLIALAIVAIAKPELAKRFLNGFASSASTHFLEVTLRIIVGVAFIACAPEMKFSLLFTIFGWMLIATSVVLMFIPWRLHRRFAEWSLPMATARMKLFGLVSLIGGATILAATLIQFT
jgi:hypothetical protein